LLLSVLVFASAILFNQFSQFFKGLFIFQHIFILKYGMKYKKYIHI
jgi:hypothetical protein